jgi:hypothetical protein
MNHVLTGGDTTFVLDDRCRFFIQRKKRSLKGLVSER